MSAFPVRSTQLLVLRCAYCHKRVLSYAQGPEDFSRGQAFLTGKHACTESLQRGAQLEVLLMPERIHESAEVARD